MLTPQQIDEVTLDTAVFGGYDTKSVDAFLETLIEDYGTLYKENALLKSKMRILVEKLEEYRANEASLRDATENARKTCDQMILEAENKCKKMQEDAQAAAQAVSAAAPVHRDADDRIAQIQQQMQGCIAALEQLKTGNTAAVTAEPETDAPDDLVAEIAANLQNLIGTSGGSGDASDPREKRKRNS